ncbi:FG-GAP-like repeat-containing protein [Myxococcota bacterium]|nr:FG-GAP-like repeat-containing protein [Myxococcota bacterium]
MAFGLLLASMAFGCGPGSPGDADSLPADDDSASPDDDATSPDDDGSPSDDDTTPPDDDSTIGDDDTTPSDDDSTPPDDDTTPTDADGDGVPAPEDCDDTDAVRYPGAIEVPCDGIDQDCDATDFTEDRFADADSDGYGDPASSLECGPSPDYVPDGSDCDDLNSGRHPDADEVSCDGVDQDCDGMDATEVRYADADGDGYGNATTPLECPSDPTYVTDATDCDDTDPSRHPGAADPCNGVDEDCDGSDFCSLEGTLDIRLADAVVYTSDAGLAGVNYVVRGGGDINGDGFDDVVVGLRGGRGRVWVLDGPVTGSEDFAVADAFLSGEHLSDNSGVVTPAGDVNGDGYGDLVIGGPAYPADDPYYAANDGITYLVYGPLSGTYSLADADGIVYGETESMLGNSVSGGGDLDGDGYDDLVLGAPRSGTGWEGAAFVFHGPVDGVHSAADADAVIGSGTMYHEAGYAVSGGEDVDADGIPDILVGTYSYGAYLVTDVPAGFMSLSAATAHFECETPCSSGAYGPRLAMPGDVDGDGGAEVLLGDPQLDLSGGAFLFHGSAAGTFPRSSAGTRFLAEASGDSAGISVAALGDVDGDGSPDLMVGAPGNDTGGPYGGAAYLFYGPVPSGDVPLITADARFVGPSPIYAAGGSVTPAGDINADGLMDLFITANAEVEGLDQTPSYLFYGRPR